LARVDQKKARDWGALRKASAKSVGMVGTVAGADLTFAFPASVIAKLRVMSFINTTDNPFQFIASLV
jgi:hypothetical protein